MADVTISFCQKVQNLSYPAKSVVVFTLCALLLWPLMALGYMWPPLFWLGMGQLMASAQLGNLFVGSTLSFMTAWGLLLLPLYALAGWGGGWLWQNGRWPDRYKLLVALLVWQLLLWGAVEATQWAGMWEMHAGW